MKMKNKFRGVWTVSVAAALLFTSACGGGTEPAKTPAAEGNSSASKEPVKLKMMANHEQANLSETDKKFVEMLEKKTNTKLEFEIPPTTGYKERLQLMLASGDYPDIVFFPATSEQAFINAVKDGIVIPVNDYLSSAKNLTKYSYQASWDALKVNQDGKIYGIPRTSVTRNDAFWVRKDWLANVGITIPADSQVTIDQFTDILRKFTLNDPDKNGKNDTYGYAGFVDGNKVLQPILTSQFGLFQWQKAPAGSKYEYMDATYDPSGAAFKKALTYTANLQKEKLLDPDSATNDGVKARERFWRGIAGVYPGFAGHYTWHTEEMRKLNPNVDLTYVFVKNEDGKVSGIGYGTGLWGFWGITKASKNPQKAVELLDAWLADDIWKTVVEGFEGMDYNKVNGEITPIMDAPKSPIRRNSMRRNNDPEFFITAGTKKEIRDLIKPWMDLSFTSVVNSKHLDYVPEAAKKPNYMDYQKVWSQTIMKIIMNEQPVSKFDELLAGWYKAGGEDFVKQMNDYIKKVETSK
jgi:putative aldouronate transport system substrate-binding protein